ncbi:hypothetical protein [Glutamicibacter sp. PS]|uniref:hypothetical protein n=1 Tax=Glutamicibacter sp. PS TaxID=3075634 RepID=UPI00283D5DDE|nr:hypothetical protein [Glutamicibacter sp. PS]MDR4533239.1 hypothetical protein [Glutamicibacter sp. PS]
MKLKRDNSQEGVFHAEWSIVEATLPDGNWPLMIGDVLNCYRSALDHIISEHVRSVHKFSASDPALKYLSFPISDSPADFRRDTKKLRDVAAPEFLAELERTQIYRFEPDAYGDFFSLTALRDLNNLDKHRGLPFTDSFWDPNDTIAYPSAMTISGFETIGTRCEPGAVFATAQVAGSTAETYMQMELKATRIEAVHIPGVTEPQDVVGLLETLGQDVMALCGAFFSHPGEPEPSNQRGCVFPHTEPWELPHP